MTVGVLHVLSEDFPGATDSTDEATIRKGKLVKIVVMLLVDGSSVAVSIRHTALNF